MNCAFLQTLRTNLLLLLVGVVLVVAPLQAAAQFNPEINYQGKLTDGTGLAVPDGTYNMNFWLVPTSGGATSTAVWSEVRTGGNQVQVTNGLFSVMLGDVSTLAAVDFDQELYLAVEIGGTGSPSWDGELLPRKILGAVPAAFYAETAGTADTAADAELLGGVASSSFLRSDEADTMAATSTSPILSIIQNGVGKVLALFSGVTEIFTVLSNGNVGLGTTTPTSRLHIDVGNFGAETPIIRFSGYDTQTFTPLANHFIGLGADQAGGNSGMLFNIVDPYSGGAQFQFRVDNQDMLSINDAIYFNSYGAGVLTTDINGRVYATATSSLGLGNNAFLGLTDTPGSFAANRIMFTNSGATALTDSATFVFDGTNLGIGTSTPNNRIQVLDLIQFNNTETRTQLGYQAGQNLVSGAAGNTFIGYQAGFSSSTASSLLADHNVGVGAYTLYSNTTGHSNTALGFEALRSNTTGANNNASGYQALYSNTTGANNIAIGKSSLQNSQTAWHNVAIGPSALQNSDAWYNIGIGTEALFSNTSGQGATAVGYNSLRTNTTGTFNTSLGYLSLYRNNTGSLNVAIGSSALYNNTNGDRNVAVGNDAGRYLINGTSFASSTDRSIYIGYSARALTADDFNSIVIGDSALGLGTNTVVLGNDSVVTTALKGNIGIGTTTPSSQLTVVGNTYIGGDLSLAGALRDGLNASGTAGMVLQTTGTSTRWVATSTLGFGSGSLFTDAGAMTYLTSTGDNLAVGTTTQIGGQRLSVAGGIAVGDNDSYRIGGTTVARVYGDNLFFGSVANSINTGSAFSNTAVGNNALRNVTTGHSNTALGAFALDSITTGDSNIAVGGLSSITTASRNSSIGGSAGGGLRSGDNNFFGGFAAGNHLATSSRSVILGAFAAEGTVDYEANNLTIIGSDAGRNLTTGANDNVFLGSYAGYLVTTGSQNLLLGYQAADNLTTGSRNIVIGTDINAASSTASNQLNIGNIIFGTAIDGTDNTLSSGNIGIGTTTPGSKLTVAGNTTLTGSLFLPSASSSGNGVVYRNGERFLYEFTPAGNDGPNLFLGTGAGNLTMGSSTGPTWLGTVNTGVGYEVLSSNTEGWRNTGVGYRVLTNNTTGRENTAGGWGSLSSNTSGDQNSAFGSESLLSNTSGFANSGFGYRSLRDNTTGIYNTAGGWGSLAYNTTGYSNTAYGADSLHNTLTGYDNTAIGTDALYNNVSGRQNTALGASAGLDLNTDTNTGANTLIGYNTGRGIVTGVNNTILGANVTGLSSTLSNNIIIADGAGNQRINVGSTGNVGIGTTTPGSRLTVAGDAYITGALRDGLNASGTAGMVLQTTGTSTRWVATSTLGIGASFSNSAQLAALLSDEVGTGFAVFNNSPAFTTQISTPVITSTTTLSIDSNGTSALNIGTGANAKTITIGNGTGATSLVLNAGTGALNIGTNTIARAITIGNTTGASSLTLNSGTGAINIGTSIAKIITIGNNTGAAGLVFNSGTAGTIFSNGNVGMGTTSTSSRLTVQGVSGTADIFRISSSTGSVLFTAAANGNIGIGTTTPATKLDIWGGFRVGTSSRSLISASTTIQQLAFGTSNIVTNIFGDVPLVAISGSPTTKRAVLLLNEESIEQFAAGEIQFGRDSNAGDRAMGRISFQNSAQINAWTDVGDPYAGSLQFWTDAPTIGAGLTERMRITSNGNVGIGTTTPGSRLTVDGDAYITGVLRDGLNASGTAGMVLQTTGTSTRWVATSTLGFGSGGGSLFTDAGATTYLTATGDNLAIGTTTAGSRLTVDGDLRLYGGINFGADTTITTVNSNLMFGGYALVSATNNDVYSNIAIGNVAGNSLALGWSNVFIGEAAGIRIATGSRSVIIGEGAVGGDYGTTDAGEMVVIGDRAGFNLQSGGSFGTFVGFRAGENVTTGGGNTLLGYRAGDNITDGYGNIVIGYDLEAQSTSQFQTLNIGNLLFGTGLDGTGTTLSSGNIGIGTTTPGSKLTVAGDFRATGAFRDSVSNSAGSNGMVLLSTGSGTQWVATSSLGLGGGGGSLFTDGGATTYLTATGDNLAIGTTTATNRLTVDGSMNVTGNIDLRSTSGSAVGVITVAGQRFIHGYSIANTPGANLFIGSHAGNFTLGSTTQPFAGVGNVGIGENSLTSLTLGDNNTALGNAALSNTTTGGSNTALGWFSMLANTTGSSNSAVGRSTLQSNQTGRFNSAFGNSALEQNISGENNVGLGAFALINNTTGNNNVAVGRGALSTNVTNEGSVALGYEALMVATASWNVAVGQQAGNTITTGGGNTIIGAFSGDGITTGTNNTIIGAGVTGLSSSLSNNIIIADGAGNRRINVDGNGFVGMGTTTPVSRLALERVGFTGAGTAGLSQYIRSTNSTLDATQYGSQLYMYASNTATSTLIGSITRMADNTTFGNTVRGLEIQADNGNNTFGENTGLAAFARTFGVRGTTVGDAGGVFEPAGVFGETEGTTQGNAIRGYSSSITSAALLKLFQDTSTFTGTGLLMNFGNAGGSFSSTTASRFIDLQNAGTSLFTVGARGMTTIGDGTTTHNAGLQIGYGGICVDNDGSCVASTTGRISAVSYYTANSDLAETYFSSENLKTGEVVSLKSGLSIGRASESNKDKVLGVVTTKPGLLLGSDDSSLNAGESVYGVALAGRVPIRLSNENGEIKAGDRLMLSSIPGVAMKASSTGMVVGIALEDFVENRAYSDTYINQFGDDLVDPIYVPVNSSNDPRINDGCYYGAGSASGNAPCVPLVGTTTDAQVLEAEALAAAEAQAAALAALKYVQSERVTLANGDEVRVGQIVMFVSLEQRYLDENGIAMVAALLASASSTSGQASETIWSRLVTLANNFIDGVLSVFTLKADRVEVTEEICVDGVCLNADDLRRLLDAEANSGNTPPPSAPETPLIPPTPPTEPEPEVEEEVPEEEITEEEEELPIDDPEPEVEEEIIEIPTEPEPEVEETPEAQSEETE